jgi:glycosyltransferase involved in cell wall biosynthesis
VGEPLVSVVLPCFNAERFLPAAVDSVLAQTHRNLEVLALDDGSRDSTPRILDRYAAADSRVRILSSDANQGLIATLNRGVAAARGEFIARMDADDVSAPHRIERQVEALVARPEVGVAGAGIELMDEDGRRIIMPRVVRCREPGAARFMGILGTPVAHTTLLARGDVMRAHPYGLSPTSLHTEDYELFSRMLAAGVGFTNLDEPLMLVRVDPTGVSLRYERIQVENFVTCARIHLERILQLRPEPAVHRVLVNRLDKGVTAHDLRSGLQLVDVVEAAFVVSERDSATEIRGIADEQRVDILLQAALKGSPAVRAAAIGLAVRYAHRLCSPRARRYLGLKRQRRSLPLVGARKLDKASNVG